MKNIKLFIIDNDLYTHLKSDDVFNDVYNSALNYALSTGITQYICFYNDEIIFDDKREKEYDLICGIKLM